MDPNRFSLFEMAKRRIIRNIDMLTDAGDIPYDILRPIISQIENPSQLRELEKNSPHIAEKDGEIWLRYIKRDFTNWEKHFKQPNNPKNWHKLYDYIKRKDSEEVAAQQEQLRAALQQLRDDKESASTKMTNKVIDPGSARRRQTLSQSYSRPPQTVTHFVGGRKVTHKTPKSALAQARKEVLQAKKQREGIMARPSHMLATLRNRGPKEAPKGWMERNMPTPAIPPPPEREKSDLKPLNMFAPSKKPAAQGISDNALAQREARLLALKKGQNASASLPTAAPAPRLPPPATSTLSHSASIASGSRMPPRTTTDSDKRHVDQERPLPHNPSYKIPAPQPSADANPIPPIAKRKRGVNVFMPSKKR